MYRLNKISSIFHFLDYIIASFAIIVLQFMILPIITV